MRITNKIMQNNSLSNINYNKTMKDKYNTQMSTQKKISRPSDDPVVAIRALRLRSNVSEVTQYYTKNIPDAESWLQVTEGALDNVSKVITDMIKQCTKGASGELTSSDRKTILESLKALRDEVYSTGDADYAGRYVFTGYRTDSSLMFQSDSSQTYRITEQLDKTAVDSVTHIKTNKGTDDILDLNESNYGGTSFTEDDIKANEVNRIRLAYSQTTKTPAPGIEYTDSAGATQTISVTSTKYSYEVPSPYDNLGDDDVIYVPDTGEILLGKNAYDKIMSTKDNPATSDVNEGEIRVTYDKNEWKKGDLKPEHYFACTTDPGAATEIKYNQDYLTSVTGSTQIMEYDVGYNQTIRVNSTADECFKHGIGREVDDLVGVLEDVIKIEEVVEKLEGLLEQKKGTADEAKVQEQLDAAKRAYTLMKDNAQKLFEQGIGTMQGYLDDANLAITNNGTRGKKLELISTRMQNQKTSFETLKSENEDVDIAEATINLTGAEMIYEAALLATGKVMKTTLLDFI